MRLKYRYKVLFFLTYSSLLKIVSILDRFHGDAEPFPHYFILGRLKAAGKVSPLIILIRLDQVKLINDNKCN